MPVPTTTDELLELIRKSELIPPQRLETFVGQAEAASSARTPRELMSLLIAGGLVTQFQAEQFLQGKWRGFTIGKYKVLERLGSGGMGTVYLCEHLMVGRKVAVKVLPTSQADNPSALGRFYREARAAGVLDHPNLVKAHDIDQEGGLHFLVMDYVDGASLQEIVSRFGPVSVARACDFVRQAANGLQAAHAAGLIHRDVKPANIMLERSGAIRLLDLGLARFYNDNVDLLTLKYDEKNVLGTADYVAPEQALNSHEVDIRADIYSLGATFYFLLTGQPPFAGGKIAQKLIWHQVRHPRPVHEVRPEVPAELGAVLEKMMAKNPAQRYQAPQEVIDALAPWTREPVPPPRPEEMPRLSPAAAAVSPAPATPSPATTRPALPIRLPRRSDQAAARLPPATEPSGQVATLHRPAAASEQATPRHLATAQAPTATEQPRPAAPVAPSRRLTESGRPLGVGLATARVVLLALVSGLVGVGLTVWALMR
jgi:eukaryotic-like serine/threonine-protein kinase